MSKTVKHTKTFQKITIPSDWEVKHFGDIANIDKTSLKSNTPEDYEFDYISLSDVDSNDFKIETTKQVFANAPSRARRVVSKGDVLMSTVRPNLQGFTLIENDVSNLIASTGFAVISTREVINSYLFQYLFSSAIERQFHQLLVGSNYPAINSSDVKKLKIPLPPLPEQKAIAQVLSTWDTAIQKTEALLAQKELRKKWLMQQLLTGKKRLKGFETLKWKIQPLNNFIKLVIREIPKPNEPYLGIGLRSHGKGTFLKHDEQPEGNSMDKFYIVRANDLIVNITFAWEQAIAIVKPQDDGALASHRFPTYQFIENKGHPDFFRFFILQAKMKYMLELISPGGAGRNRVMNKSDFIKLEFLLPDYEEQVAIAQVLQAADKEIELIKAKTAQLREQKKGLMQQLLTGKIRMLKN
uniref:restriction endonuclease subunit S n=1 Tax=Gelidibacter japonicus TaxID=1962232 RepID=UPI0024C36CA4|nr:restriction endonuclease subunit S [Gelidibacter japonicus]